MTDIDFRIIGTRFHGKQFVGHSGTKRLDVPFDAVSFIDAEGNDCVSFSTLQYRLVTMYGSSERYVVWVPADVKDEDVMRYVLEQALRSNA